MINSYDHVKIIITDRIKSTVVERRQFMKGVWIGDNDITMEGLLHRK